MKKEQDIDSVHVEKIKKIAESLLENESNVYRKGSSHISVISIVSVYDNTGKIFQS